MSHPPLDGPDRAPTGQSATGTPPDGRAVFQAGDVVASRFRIVRYIAQGGMGELYEAEDLELHERVALKTILSGIADDERAIVMFKREVHLARQVTHPNVCRIYDVFRHPRTAAGAGEPAGEVVFLSMELLHGETLAEKLRREGRLPLSEILPILRQMAGGLSAAHRAGVVHRDFKSHNVMLVAPASPGQELRVVVTDFGLARRGVQEERTMSLSLGDAGEISGTPAYMAPEQIEGGPVTPATDVYALGVVLYEMVTGVWPFVGETPLATAIKRLQHAPPPPTQHVPDVDRRWEATILRCLARRPEDRFAGAEDVVADLDAPHRASPRRRPKTIAAAVAAIAAIAVAASIAAPLYSRLHTPAPLTDKDTIVLADFVNTTGDAVFDETLKKVLAIQLEQSPFLRVLPDRTVNATLKLMNRPPTEPLTEAVTREICVRTNSTVFLVGSIASLGSEYVIGLDAVNCQTGERLSRQQVQSPRKEDVLSTVSQSTTRLRETIGESLSTIQKYDTPISEATTSSLAALQAYSLGNKANEASGSNAAIPLLRRAIELDPDFALAHSFLGIVYANIQELGLAGEHFRKAYELRGRVSERENLRISAYYFSYVTGEVEKGNQAYELWARAYSRDYIPRNNLGRNYQSLGRYEEALPEMLEAIRLDPGNSVPYSNLVEIYCRLNRLSEARAAYQQALALNLDRPGLRYNMYGVAFLEVDAPEMGRLVAWAAGKPGVEDFLLSHQSDTEAYSGHLRQARELSRRATESALAAGQKETAAIRQLNAALREAEFGNPAEARRLAASALSMAATLNTETLAALAMARAGDTERARELADGLEQANPLNTRINGYWLPTIRATIEINRQNPAKAIEILESAARYELGVANPQPQVGGLLYPVYVRAQAYLLLRQGSAAAAEHQKYLNHKSIAVNCALGPLSQLGLARAYALIGDAVKARAAYQEFLTLWKDADADIPILKAARAESERAK